MLARGQSRPHEVPLLQVHRHHRTAPLILGSPFALRGDSGEPLLRCRSQGLVWLEADGDAEVFFRPIQQVKALIRLS